MTQLVVHHDVDPGIAIVLKRSWDSDPVYQGACTECGQLIRVDAPSRSDGRIDDRVVKLAKEHVNTHESGL